jgi:L-lactate utilization protein LutC
MEAAPMSVDTRLEAARFARAFAPLVDAPSPGNAPAAADAAGDIGGAVQGPHGGLRVCADLADAADWIAQVLGRHAAARAVLTARPELAALGAPTSPLHGAGCELFACNSAAPPSTRAIAVCDAGIGGADRLIAETGSLVLVHSVCEPRELSLLPRLHIVVAPVQRIVPRLADALAQLPPMADFVIVTGPSRTADVEKTLVVPAHGPGWLYVALLA